MTNRQNIYLAIDGEREYQDSKWGPQHDSTHEVEAFTLYMQSYLTKAIHALSSNKGVSAGLEELRKVVALGVACFENHGVPYRTVREGDIIRALTGK